MPPMRKQSNSTFSTRHRERNCECWLAFRITSFFLRFTPPAYTSWRLSTPCILCSLSTPPYRIPATCWSKTGKCQFYISPPLVAEKRGRRCRKKRTTMRCRFLKQEIYWWLNSSRSFHSQWLLFVMIFRMSLFTTMEVATKKRRTRCIIDATKRNRWNKTYMRNTLWESNMQDRAWILNAPLLTSAPTEKPKNDDKVDGEPSVIIYL